MSRLSIAAANSCLAVLVLGCSPPAPPVAAAPPSQPPPLASAAAEASGEQCPGDDPHCPRCADFFPDAGDGGPSLDEICGER
ncbi:MAG: hypothetical protein HY744_12620 [Deltaproteobacteria bacterium]|nr:hypothetical protein [Deltaproteobacteria bacterium]